jgi:hypothetical protein
VEFAGDRGSAALIGGGPAAMATRGGREASTTRRGREAEGSRGSKAAVRRAWQAGPIVRWPSVTPSRQDRQLHASARRLPRTVPCEQGW